MSLQPRGSHGRYLKPGSIEHKNAMIGMALSFAQSVYQGEFSWPEGEPTIAQPLRVYNTLRSLLTPDRQTDGQMCAALIYQTAFIPSVRPELIKQMWSNEVQTVYLDFKQGIPVEGCIGLTKNIMAAGSIDGYVIAQERGVHKNHLNAMHEATTRLLDCMEDNHLAQVLTGLYERMHLGNV